MSRFLTILVFNLFLYFLSNVTASPKQIRCPLVWLDISLGSSFPENAVSTDLRNNKSHQSYLGKIKFGGKYKTIGINFNDLFSSVFWNDAFPIQILTNKFNCKLKWISVENKQIPKKLLATVNGDNEFIGGIKLEENDQMIHCNLKFGQSSLCKPFQDHSVLNFYSSLTNDNYGNWSTIFVLKSFAKLNLQVEIQDAEIISKKIGNYNTNFSECDKIHNKGEAELSKTFTLFTETANEWKVDLNAGAEISLDNAQIEVELTILVWFNKVISGSLSLHLAAEVELNFGADYSQRNKIGATNSYRVNLPPRTLIEVCSSNIVRETEINFIGTFGKVSHPYLRPREILEIIKRDSRFPKSYINEGKVIVEGLEGTAKIVEPMHTELVLNPLNAVDFKRLK